MTELLYWAETVTTVANAYALDPQMVLALIWIESRGRADAFRHEPKFWLRYLATKSEYKGMNPRRVSSSYGLMQIMYSTARELGYDQEPEGLFLPRTNLHWGCRYFKHQLDWANQYPLVPGPDRLTAALAAYNGGRGGNTPGTELRPVNAAYAARVRATLNTLRDQKEV